MKKYTSPRLVTYGNVETLTQANGASAASDFLIFNGTPIASGTSANISIGPNTTINVNNPNTGSAPFKYP
jgi:hypothetical protein